MRPRRGLARLARTDLLVGLREEGYVIVHPDDHPNPGINGGPGDADALWNDIFGGS
jgi:hypothetical protein